jgi:hypothetical protein
MREASPTPEERRWYILGPRRICGSSEEANALQYLDTSPRASRRPVSHGVA